MKITLAEFDEFQKSLTDDWYFIDDNLSDEFWDGKFDPLEVINVNKGDITIAWQGKGQSPKEEYLDFLSEFKKWKNDINFDIFTVKIPKNMRGEFMKFIKSNGGVKL